MPKWAYLLAALATVAMLLAFSLPVPAGASTILAAIASALFVVVAIPPLVKVFRRRDPYDLNALREVHQRAEWDEVEAMRIDEDADVVCPNCGTVYGSVMPRCPNCRSCCG